MTLMHQLAFCQGTYPKKEIRGKDTVVVILKSQSDKINEDYTYLDQCEELLATKDSTIESYQKLNTENEAILKERQTRLDNNDKIEKDKDGIIKKKDSEISKKDNQIFFQKLQKKFFMVATAVSVVINGLFYVKTLTP